MIRVLAGDVGASKTVLALYQGEDAGDLSSSRHETFENAAFGGFPSMLAEFLRGVAVDAAACALAGTVNRGLCEHGRLPWAVREADLRPVLGTQLCTLLNDVQAAALGIRDVPPERLVWLQEAQAEPEGAVALVSVGASYGRALWVPPDRAFASEAGHASFAPRNVIERRLLEFLAERHERVGLEHVLSGQGLKQLYDFLVAEALAPNTAMLELERAEDPNVLLGRLGCNELDHGCAAAVAFFADLLGAELGNVALECLPHGGLYVSGAVARGLRPALEKGELLDGFRDKGAPGGLLEDIPLALIDEPELSLLGALRVAKRSVSVCV